MRNEGSFGPDDVVRGIVDKLVRRHPHVFGDVEVERLERGAAELGAHQGGREEGQRGSSTACRAACPRSTRAQRVGEKVERVGFDWPDARGSRAKVAEEMGELDAAIAEGDKARVEDELGDVLFALVNLARHVDVDAEGALRGTDRQVSAPLRARRGAGEGGARRLAAPTEARRATSRLPLEELDGYWDEAKQNANDSDASGRASARRVEGEPWRRGASGPSARSRSSSWIHARGVLDPGADDRSGRAAARSGSPRKGLGAVARVVGRAPRRRRTRKVLLKLGRRRDVETVIIPANKGNEGDADAAAADRRRRRTRKGGTRHGGPACRDRTSA